MGNVMRGSNIALFKQASPAQRTAAWQFMKWLDEPAQAAYWAERTGYVPVSKTAAHVMSHYIAAHPLYQAAIAALPTAREVAPVPGMTQALGALGNALQEVLVGHMPVSQALSAAQQQALSDVTGK
jgi:ABC-type glycerol-3-phosphate transport system substrate-binding protein